MLAFSTAPSPASAGVGEIYPSQPALYNICNSTNLSIDLAIAYGTGAYSDPHVVSAGWWTIKPTECVKLFPQESQGWHRYLYATATDESGQRYEFSPVVYSVSDQVIFCDDRNSAFVYRDEEAWECPHNDFFVLFPDRDLTISMDSLLALLPSDK